MSLISETWSLRISLSPGHSDWFRKRENHPNKTQKFSARTIVERFILPTHFAKLLEYEMELPTTILLPPGESLRRKQRRGKREGEN